MKKNTLCLIVTVLALINTIAFGATYNLEGPLGHLDIWGNNRLNMSDGSVFSIRPRDNSRVTLSGGTVRNAGLVRHNSSFTITGGAIKYYLYPKDQSTTTILGGSVGGGIYAYDKASTHIKGGYIGEEICVSENSMIYLYGQSFMVDGQRLKYGDRLSDYGTVGDSFGYPASLGNITGMLQDGTPLDVSFSIRNTDYYAGDADIIIIPEPCSLILLGLGGLVLRRRRALYAN